MTAKLTGRERAIRRMLALPDAIKRRVRAQLEENAADMVRLAKSRAPVADVDGGELRDSIRQYDASDETGLRRRVVAGDASTVKDNYAYPRAVEFGTQNMPAQPFFFPTYRQRRKQYRRKLNKAAKDGIKEALGRP
jgi:HK97 gp10 family phage protein